MEMDKLREIAKMAAKTPYRVYHTVVEGFSFGVYWDTNHKWFECCMLYSPHYSGKSYIYGYDIDKLIENADAEIVDAKKTFINGGHFPEDYYKIMRESLTSKK